MTKLIEAFNYLKSQKIIDLSHVVSSELPHFPVFQPLKSKQLTSVKEDGFLAHEFTIASQYGTHIDAPVHFAEGQINLNEIDYRDYFLPLYVIHKEDEVARDSDYALSIQDILDFEAEYGKIPEEAFVAFSSGWSERFNDKEKVNNTDSDGIDHTPGWSLEALRFLHEERNVTAIGHETLNTDTGVDYHKNGDLVGERYWLEQGKYQIEVLKNLRQVPPVGGVIFIGVPNIEEASGFTARVFAIVPKE